MKICQKIEIFEIKETIKKINKNEEENFPGNDCKRRQNFQ